METPRRIRLDLNTPAELAIYNAMLEVEKIGADIKLTEAVVALQKAKELVADFVDRPKEEVLSKFDTHNSSLIEELKQELKEKTSCDSSWHSGVNDGMYYLLQRLANDDRILTDGHRKTIDEQRLKLSEYYNEIQRLNSLLNR